MHQKEYVKRKRSTGDPQSKQERNKSNKEYMKTKRSEPVNKSIQSLILRFHNIVSQGPLCICTCCDQLWYKHSVLPAATLKKTNPAIEKNLLHKTSVHSFLYIEEGISFNQNWLNNYSNGLLPEYEDNIQGNEHQSEKMNSHQIAANDEDNWSEDEVEIHAGVTDTMLTATDFMTNNEHQKILNVSPDEGSTPLSIFRDKIFRRISIFRYFPW